MSSENKRKIPVEVKDKSKSKKRSILRVVKTLIKSRILYQFDEKMHQAEKAHRSAKLIIGLIIGFLTIAIISLSIMALSALTWLSQNTVLPEQSTAFVTGGLLGYLAALTAAIIYSKYY